MIEKVNLKQVLVIAGIGLAINFMFRSCGTASPGIRELQTSTDRSLGTVKAESAGIGVEIERSKIASDNAQKAIGRINDEINDYRGRINEISTGINDIERDINECERLARESAKIFDRVDGSN